MVLLEVEERLDVRVPRLKVAREGALALAAALVDEARGRVEDTPGCWLGFGFGFEFGFGFGFGFEFGFGFGSGLGVGLGRGVA